MPAWAPRWFARLLIRFERAAGRRRAASVPWLLALAVAAAGVLLLVGPVINRPPSLDDLIEGSSAVDAWEAESFEADYTLGKTDDGHSRLEVTERIAARFDADDPADGIQRRIPAQLNTHDLRPALASATIDGSPVDATTSRSPHTATFRLHPDEPLTGTHDVELNYVVHDVAATVQDDSTQTTDDVLEWNAFGTGLPHPVGHTSVSLTVPKSLVDEFTRTPTGSLIWTIVGSTADLEPESSDADSVTYALTNDQTLPPNAALTFDLGFAEGTFSMPPPSTLYWIEAFGPFVPLALLALVLLTTVVSRFVVWRDKAGQPWHVYREDPPDVSPQVASRLWRAVRVAPLVGAVTDYQAAQVSASRRRLVHRARRAGRLGHLPAAWSQYLASSSWSQVFSLGLRAAPSGRLRWLLILWSAALTLLQWGLLRQLSHQTTLTVEWWSTAVVWLSTAGTAGVVLVALTAWPLTRKGAAIKDQLIGLRMFVRRTLRAERTGLDDPLLPYVTLFQPPRRAGALIGRLADDAGVGEKVARDPKLVTPGRLIVRIVGGLLVPAAIAVAIVVPALAHPERTDPAYDTDLPGSYGVFVTDFASDATMSVTDSNRVRIDVTEDVEVDVASGLSSVPQVVRQWRDRVAGHDMDLTVDSVTVDGDEVDYDVRRVNGQALLLTHVSDSWPGEHTVHISYALTDAAGAVLSGFEWRDQVRFTALTAGWRSGWSSPDVDPQHIALSVTVPEELADQAVGESGWLGTGSWPDTGVTEVRSETDDGAVTYAVDLEAYDDDGVAKWRASGYRDEPALLTRLYQGVQLQLPAGTVETGSHGDHLRYRLLHALPYLIPNTLAVVVIGGALGAVAWTRGRRRITGIRRDIATALPLGGVLAHIITVFWAIGGATASEPITSVAWPLLLTIPGAITALVVVVRNDRRRD